MRSMEARRGSTKGRTYQKAFTWSGLPLVTKQMSDNFSTASSSITSPTSVSKTSVSKSRVHGILWTLYNYDSKLTTLREFAVNETKYTVFGFEKCPTTGRDHLQGYFYFENARTYPNKQIRKLFEGIHDQVANGSALDNRKYCLKIREGDIPNEKYEEFGVMPTQGERTDWKRVVSDLQAGASIISVVSEQPHVLPAIRSLEKFRNMIDKSTHRDVKVILLVGSPGTGKTRWAWENYPDLYSKPEGHWWDGYSGQETILLDDYYGDISYSTFLKVLDRYPLNLPIKGGFVPAKYTTVIITSNKPFTHWYIESSNAIARRIHEIKNLDTDYNNAS